MMDLPMQAEVQCSDGTAGRSTYVIVNPINRQITHLVVKSDWPPFHEVLVPIDQVEETTPDLIKLKGTRSDLDKMEPFEKEVFIRTKIPDYERLKDGYLTWPYALSAPGIITQEVDTHIPVKLQNIPPGALALHRGAHEEPGGHRDERRTHPLHHRGRPRWRPDAAGRP